MYTIVGSIYQRGHPMESQCDNCAVVSLCNMSIETNSFSLLTLCVCESFQ